MISKTIQNIANRANSINNIKRKSANFIFECKKKKKYRSQILIFQVVESNPDHKPQAPKII